MQDGLSGWLEDRVQVSRRLSAPTLVLCRTRSAATAVRRWLAQRGGLAGVDVATPAGLAAQVVSGLVDPQGPGDDALQATLPEDSAIREPIRDRPGLTALARRWVQALRSARLGGLDVSGAPDWLLELEASGWGMDKEHVYRERLLELAQAGGRRLSESWSWKRVFLVGFDVEDAAIEPWVRALVDALGGERAPAPAPGCPLPAVEVPDVLAEARLAAWLALPRPSDTLILLTEETTARRVRDTLRRNGIPCAWRDNAPLLSHAVASALLRCVDWFAQGCDDPLIRVSDLAFVLGQTQLGRKLHPAAQAWLERRLEEEALDPADARLGRRSVADVLGATHLLDAPLPRWIERLQALRQETPDGETRRSVDRARALALEARLRVLQACVEGEAFASAFEDVPAVLDDFDAIVAELLGEPQDLEEPDPPGTLGALKRFLVACRVRLQGDAAVQAILGRLNERKRWPASAPHLLEVLAGATDPGLVASGVDILHVDDYDGRPASRLLLLDVHDKGLARRPAPDPLLTDAQIRALGCLSGADLVAWRIGQVHRAAAAASEVIAVVSRRDAGGRDVVAPVQLDLIDPPALFDESRSELPEEIGSYGLNLDLPELRPSRGLLVDHGPTPLPPPADADPVLRHLALQASAEWVREARGPRTTPPPSLSRYAPLVERLKAGPLAPPWLTPWLGHAEGTPEASLPEDREYSYSGLFRPLTHCLYQAWLKGVLRLQEPRTVSEELDPREVGQAVHDALEAVGPGAPWRVRRRQDLDAAVEVLVEALAQATEQAFAAAVDRIGGLSPARWASVSGQVERWKVHWRSWARDRVQPQIQGVGDLEKLLGGHPDLEAAREAFLADQEDREQVKGWVVDAWLLWVARQLVGGEDPRALPDELLLRRNERHELPWSWAERARAFLERTELQRLARTWWQIQHHAAAISGDLLGTGAEIPFGEGEEGHGQLRLGDAPAVAVHLGPVRLRLGSAFVHVRGRIDRLSVVRGPRGPLLHIVDYKTGRGVPTPWVAQRALWSLKEPQLVIYAMALTRGLEGARILATTDEEAEAARAALEGAVVAALGWDYLHQTPDRNDPDRKVQRLDGFLLDDRRLFAAARDLGWLLDEGRAGRWPLHPRADTCPALTSWSHDYCPFQGACRLRRLPGEGA